MKPVIDLYADVGQRVVALYGDVCAGGEGKHADDGDGAAYECQSRLCPCSFER